jgi:hypothetical protein
MWLISSANAISDSMVILTRDDNIAPVTTVEEGTVSDGKNIF